MISVLVKTDSITTEKLTPIREVNSFIYHLLTHMYMISNLIVFPEHDQCILNFNTLLMLKSCKSKNLLMQLFRMIIILCFLIVSCAIFIS